MRGQRKVSELIKFWHLINVHNSLYYLILQEKFLDEFSKMVPILHSYDRQVPDRNVMVFVPTDELKEEAMKAGAFSAGKILFPFTLLKRLQNIHIKSERNFDENILYSFHQKVDQEFKQHIKQ